MPENIRCFKTGGPCTVDVQEKPRSVFVIMPFAETFDDVYELGIKASVETLDWECLTYGRWVSLVDTRSATLLNG